MNQVDVGFACITENIDRFQSMSLPTILSGVKEVESRGKTAVVSVISNQGNRRFTSAAAGLNWALDSVAPRLMVCLHDDIVGSWGRFFDWAFDPSFSENAGVMGMVGREQSGVAIIWGKSIDKPFQTMTVDECCFAFRTDRGLRFDQEVLTHWHQYAPDLCLQHIAKGLPTYIIPNGLDHVGGRLSINHDGKNFIEQYQILSRKWASQFPRIVRT